jgi:hypothetical protein
MAGAAAPAPGEPAAPAACEKGKVMASEVIFMGESFYALYPYIQDSLQELARMGGALGAMDRYRMYAVSAQLLTGTIPGQFDTAKRAGDVKFVIMDGGGNDCMSSSCPMCPMVFETLLKHMGEEGVEDVLYTRYPEPGVPPNKMQPLAGNLDVLMPKMEEVCKASVTPKCHWTDLRPVWKPGDCQDGLHPTPSGGQHVAEAIWATMQQDCLAQ